MSITLIQRNLTITIAKYEMRKQFYYGTLSENS